MRLAFRVVVDSRDKGYDFTPDFVREAGTKGASCGEEDGHLILMTLFFKSIMKKFVWALAKDFGNPDEVDFIDGTGLGKVGRVSHYALFYGR